MFLTKGVSVLEMERGQVLLIRKGREREARGLRYQM